ncbi:MAG: hypothetical protein JJ899_17370, partial [Alphaproteobacteria bacterium]|nr:hypothetical protein [Alphaproteobacteria bacterium]
EWQPDVVVFAYITDDLTRARFWRTYTTAHGGERILTTTVPERDPPLDVSSDTAIVNVRATRDWCQSAVKARRDDDPLIAELEQSVRVARANNEGRASLWSLSHAYLFDRIVHGNAFYRLSTRVRPSQNPRHEMTGFDQDERFRESLAAIRETGVPVVVVHLATADELAVGAEYVFRTDQEKLLNSSLSEVFRSPIYETIGAAVTPAGGYAAIKRSPSDAHPSATGMEFYADVVTTAVMEAGLP